MKTLSQKQILALHSALIKEFGGSDGIRDQGLLESALAAPFQTFGGEPVYPFYINPNYSISHLVYQLYLTLTSHIGCGEICIDFL